MKKLFISLLLLIGLPVFASNNLQRQYEGDLTKLSTEAFPIQDAVYLINDDFKSYDNGDSIYGYLLNVYDECNKQNRKVDLLYINKATSSYKQAFDKQTVDILNYIAIEDEDYSTLAKDTKDAIKAYNLIATLAQRKNIDYSAYYTKLNQSKNKFSTDKNNIKQNFEMQLSLYEDKQQIDDYAKTLKYRNNSNITDINKLEALSKEIETFCLEIYNYSYAYEKEKYKNWQTKNNKKIKVGTLQQFVYDGRYQPKMGGLYTHDPKDLYLIVKQTVPGCIIITGRHDLGSGFYTINDIYLQTVKSFADGAYITEPIVAEYKGFYDYTTVLGAKRRIYKFYRYGQSEIDANFKIPGEKFYFYGWDGKF